MYPNQRLQQYAFSAAGAAHDAHLLAVGNVQIDVPQHGFSLNAHGAVLDLKVYLLYGPCGNLAAGDLGLAAHKVHHLPAGYQLLLHLEHAVVDLSDELHDLHYIIGAGHQITDEHIAFYDQNGAHGDAADVGGLPDQAEHGLERGGELHLLNIGLPHLLVRRIEFFLFQPLVGEGAHQPDSLDVFLNRQAHIAVVGPDHGEILLCQPAETQQGRSEKRNQGHGDDQQIGVDPRQQQNGRHQYEKGVEHIGDDPAEQILVHDGVGVQDRQQLPRVVAGDSIAVQLHELVEGGSAQIRLQPQPQLLIDDVEDIYGDLLQQDQAHEKKGQRPEKLHGMDFPIFPAEQKGEDIIVRGRIVLHDIVDEHGCDEGQQKIRSQRHAAHSLCEDSPRCIFLPVSQPELQNIHSLVSVFFPARRCPVSGFALGAVFLRRSAQGLLVLLRILFLDFSHYKQPERESK